MIDCLIKYAELIGPLPDTGGPAGAIDAVFDLAMGEKLELATQHGFAFHAGVDAVTATCNRAFADCALPRETRAVVRLPGSAEPCLEEIVLGIVRSARAHGLALAEVAYELADTARIDVQTRASRVRPPGSPQVQDVIVALVANGLHERGHRPALNRVSASDSHAAERITQIFALQKAYNGVLFEPLRAGWYRRGLAVAATGLSAGLAGLLSEGLVPELKPQVGPEVANCRWMLEPDVPASHASVGMALFVPQASLDALVAHVGLWGETAWPIGEVRQANTH